LYKGIICSIFKQALLFISTVLFLLILGDLMTREVVLKIMRNDKACFVDRVYELVQETLRECEKKKCDLDEGKELSG